MDDALKDGCGDDFGGESCAICRGEELGTRFIAILQRAVVESGRVMTAEEAIEWLRSA